MRKIRTKVLILMALIVIPLLLVLFLYNLYSLNILNNQVANNNQNTISIYQKPVIQDIEFTQYYLANSLANDSDMLQLNYISDRIDAFINMGEIASDYAEFLNMGLDGVAALGIYSGKHDLYRMVYNSKAKNSYTYQQKNEISKYFRSVIKEDNKNKGKWNVQQIGDEYYLTLALNNDDVYTCALVDFKFTKKPQDVNDDSENGFLFYATNEGIPITMKEVVTDWNIEILDNAKDYYISGGKPQRFMVVQEELDYGGVRQVYISPYHGVLKYLDYVQVILMVLSIGLALLLPISYYFMRRTLFLPLQSLLNTMEMIKAGDLGAHMEEDFRTEEFIQVRETFNTMIDKIKQLRISTYEKEIQIKNTELQYLQIQIKPHFYLNCLKNIYALAQQKEYQNIQDMIIVFSDYIRSMFRNNPSFISVRDELHSVSNYMLLQQMSLSNHPQYRIDVDEELLDCKIPPLSILTFVENSVKYGAQLKKTHFITLKISLLRGEGEAFLCITIIDNGCGFSEEMLQKLNDNQDSYDKDHIGIMNVKKRIELIYKGRGTILFSNCTGACIEIYIPYEETQTRGDVNDSIDCR